MDTSLSQLQSESEWTERKAEELKKYIEDFETVKPSTINHGKYPNFTHFLVINYMLVLL